MFSRPICVVLLALPKQAQ